LLYSRCWQGSEFALYTKNGQTYEDAPANAVGRVARVARGGDASTSARSWCVRSSRRPLCCCCCPSRAGWPSACCCTGMAECVDVEHDHQGCCLLELRPGHHEPLLRDVPGPAQLARHAIAHARARRQGQLCGLACSPMRTCCTSTYGVLGLWSWPTCCTSGERPPRDLSIGVRLVGSVCVSPPAHLRLASVGPPSRGGGGGSRAALSGGTSHVQARDGSGRSDVRWRVRTGAEARLGMVVL
jgi:hypothetical protein